MQVPTGRRLRNWTIALAVVGPFAFLIIRVLIHIFGDQIFVLVLSGAVLFIVFSAWVAVSFFDALAVALSVREREWRRFSFNLVLLLVILATGVNLGLVWRAGEMVGDYVHLFALYPRYMAEVSGLPEPRFKAWQWDFSGPCGSGIAYDESGAIASSHRTTSDGLVGTVDVHGESRAFGHFYFAGFC
jgi:hypothetical protein